MTNSIGIRRAEQTDMAACAGILNRWIDATAWMPRVHEHADVERYYAETVFAERIVLLAEDDGEIAGFLSSLTTTTSPRFTSMSGIVAQALAPG